MSLAPVLILRKGDRDRLAELARLPSVPSGLAKRARMVLLAADGMPNAQIARVTVVSADGWRDGGYRRHGIMALEDEPRSGPPRHYVLVCPAQGDYWRTTRGANVLIDHATP